MNSLHPWFCPAVYLLAIYLSNANLHAEDLWSNAGTLSESFNGHTATLLDDERVLVAGGITPDGTGFGGETTKSATIFDPPTGTWTATTSMLNLHANHSALRLDDGRILVCGGFEEGFNPPTTKCEIFDPETETWSHAGALPTGVSGHSAAVLDDGRILLVGGLDGDFSVQASAVTYSPSSNSWTATGSMGTARFNHEATLLSNGMVLVSGGTNENFEDLATTELYDPGSGTWSSSGSMSGARAFSTTSLLQDGRVMVAGGFEPDPEGGGSIVGTTETYDPTTGIWSPGPTMLTPRGTASTSLLDDGRLLVVGGQETDFLPIASTEIFDPVSNTWSMAPPMDGHRVYPSAILLNDGRVLVIGGEEGDQFLGSPATAEVYKPDSMPPPDSSFASAATLAGLSGDQALPDAIPFGDGIENILKFAFNMNLTGPDSATMAPGGDSGLPIAGLIEVEGEAYWQIEFLRRKDSDLVYTPLKSTTLDPGSFEALTGSTTVQAVEGTSGWERVIIAEPYDPSLTRSCFSLVRVELP